MTLTLKKLSSSGGDGDQQDRYEERARELCMDFCYFDREYEVYSEIEGL